MRGLGTEKSGFALNGNGHFLSKSDLSLFFFINFAVLSDSAAISYSWHSGKCESDFDRVFAPSRIRKVSLSKLVLLVAKG